MSEFSLAELVHQINAQTVVELGTGDGATAAQVMKVLGKGTLTCVNWPNPPSGDNPWRYLETWRTDPRLKVIFGDTRNHLVVAQVPDQIDLLFIDSTHTYECAQEEWWIYRPKLKEGATVVVDDLNHNDMWRFWHSIPFPKEEYRNGTLGVFTYEP